MTRTAIAAVALFLIVSLANATEPAPRTVFGSGQPRTTSNNDSCDIALLPAATLLLPWFEQSLTARDLSTIVSVVNVSPRPQIVQFTIWTDRSFPVLVFDVFLTGFDVQGINLYDVLANGIVAPGPWAVSGTSSNSIPGSLSGANTSNPKLSLAGCDALPGALSPALMADVRSALTTGNTSTQNGVGNVHTNAAGFVTIDVVANCTPALPTAESYYTGTLLFDNVLIGDYARVSSNPAVGNFDNGEPLVPIRAIPEGGNAGAPAVATNLPYTFYDRFTPAAARSFDRRQPLPATFAARTFEESLGAFSTTFTLWREGVTAGSSASVAENAVIPLTEIVRFDDSENAMIAVHGDVNADSQISVADIFYLINHLFIGGPAPVANADPNGDGVVMVSDVFFLINAVFTGGPPPGRCALAPCRKAPPSTAAAARMRVADTDSVPPRFNGSGDRGGWVYLNLNNGGSPAYGSARAAGTPLAGVSQNWVTVSIQGENRYSYDFFAPALGNGCTPNPGITSPTVPIAPAVSATSLTNGGTR